MNRYLLFLLAFVLFSSTCQCASIPKILIVHSYDRGQICGQPQEEGLLQGLAQHGYVEGNTLEVDRFYMDSKETFNRPRLLKERGQAALAAVQRLQPDLVVTLDDNAAGTVMLGLAGSSIPVVFCGMNVQPEEYNQQTPFMKSRSHPGYNVTGVFEKLHIVKSIKVLREIAPGQGKVIAIVDDTPTGRVVQKQLELELAEEGADIPFEIWTACSSDDYRAFIVRINDDPTIAAVYPVAVTLTNGKAGYWTAGDMIRYTVSHLQKPDLAVNYFFSQQGFLGGAAVDFIAMGRQVADKVAAILHGTDPGSLSIDDATRYALVFNLERSRQLHLEIPPYLLVAADLLYDTIGTNSARLGEKQELRSDRPLGGIE
jgi:hypothetical protein